jgi:hypothetical protein
MVNIDQITSIHDQSVKLYPHSARLINAIDMDITNTYNVYIEGKEPNCKDKKDNCIVKYNDGSIYIGQIECGGRRGGCVGILIKENGQIYEGSWMMNLRAGPGKFTDGNVVTKCNWYNDHMMMEGKYTYPNGDIFDGIHDPNNGYKHGKGKMIYANQDVFKGKFWNDNKYTGKMNFQNGDFFDGKWDEWSEDNGLKTGKLLKADGSIVKYDEGKEGKIIKK